MNEVEISEIEKTIKERIELERNRSINELNNTAHSAAERINGVYTSCMKTLEQLGLVDSDLFKYFWKTKGNIKVIEHEQKYNGYLAVDFGEGRSTFTEVQLQGERKYRTIIMITEIE